MSLQKKNTWYKISHAKSKKKTRNLYFQLKGNINKKVQPNETAPYHIIRKWRSHATVAIQYLRDVTQKNMMETPIVKHPTATHGLNRSPVPNNNYYKLDNLYVQTKSWRKKIITELDICISETYLF